MRCILHGLVCVIQCALMNLPYPQGLACALMDLPCPLGTCVREQGDSVRTLEPPVSLACVIGGLQCVLKEVKCVLVDSPYHSRACVISEIQCALMDSRTRVRNLGNPVRTHGLPYSRA